MVSLKRNVTDVKAPQLMHWIVDCSRGQDRVVLAPITLLGGIVGLHAPRKAHMAKSKDSIDWTGKKQAMVGLERV